MRIRRSIALFLAVVMVFTACSVSAFAAEDDTDIRDCEILFDGEGWRVYPIDSTEDTLFLEDLKITLVDPDGEPVPEDAYELVVGTFGWDEESERDVFTEISEPFSLMVDDDYMQAGFGGFAVYAVAKDDSGYSGQTEPREFMLWHRYSFNWFGANADFGEEYKGQCMWSWHDYFEIPADQIEEPMIHGIAYEDIDPQYYEITYFERGEIPDFDDPEYDKKLYPEDEPLSGLPTEIGSYFARIDGKEPYYGTSYVDFDVVVPSADFSRGYEVLIDGEEWKIFSVENITDELTVDDLQITLKDADGEIMPSDVYELKFGTFVWDEESERDIFTETSEPFSLMIDDDYMQAGFGGFAVYAVAKDDSGYSGQTEPREFMLWHRYSFNWFGANADFGEEYKRQSTWSWHDYFEIPADQIEEPVIHGIAYEDVDPQYYEITYFERGERPDFDDPGYDNKLYPEDEPLDGLPTETGSYFARIDGKEPYYGTSYVDFDIFEDPESFAIVRGSDRRYYDGDTIYLNKGEEVFICFDTEPYSALIPGWRNDLLKNDGFTIEDDPRFFEGDDFAYAHVTAKDLQAGTVGTLYYNWYRFEDVFDEHGGMHWDEAVPVVSSSVKIAVAPDEVDYYLGDADGDGDVTIMDVTLLQRSLAGLKLDNDSTLMQADVDGNGTLESVDATFIQRRLANMKVPFDVGKPMVKEQ